MHEDILTIAEIEARYPSEFVLVGDPQFDENYEVIRGKILCHSPNQEVVYEKAVELKPKSSAFMFTGDFPDDTEFAL